MTARSRRPPGWWRAPEFARLILSGLTLSKVAKKLGSSTSLVSRWRSILFEEARAAHSEEDDRLSSNPSTRMSQMRADPWHMDQQRAGMRRLNADPAYKAAHAERMRAMNADPQHKAIIRSAASAQHLRSRKRLKDIELASRGDGFAEWMADTRPFGVCLKSWQAGHALTRNEAAARLGIARSTYDACCAGRPLAKEREIRAAMQRYDQMSRSLDDKRTEDPTL